ncbi:tyrosine-type recombinase/integrase [Neoaquamicrobium sediminum]|uniref:Site-specific integrase n=1 Tax=Neoaquamicrobium sediminum TaxID=1849104 RepID=A0ABV3WT20_9HYPH
MTFSFDKPSINALEPPEKGNFIRYDRGHDKSVTGLGIRVTAGGSKAFILNYRIGRRERRLTIGDWPDWSITAARDYAAELKRDKIDRGIDPLGEREAQRDAKTISDLCDRFLSDYVAHECRPSTATDYAALIRLYIRPELKRVPVADLTQEDVKAVHRKITEQGKTYAANRMLAVLSKMMNLAIQWKWTPDPVNPVKGVKKNPEVKRKAYLKPAELARVSAALENLRDQQSANAIRLIMLTGARRSEVLKSRWDQFNHRTRVWTKPGATTKQGTEHEVHLSRAAAKLVIRMYRAARERAAIEGTKMSPYLFPNQGLRQNLRKLKRGEKPAKKTAVTPYQIDVKNAWAKVTAEAGIAGFRVHDLRHTYASVLVSAGLSLPLIGALLGHTQAQTTQRYAHLMADPQRAAANLAAAKINSK